MTKLQPSATRAASSWEDVPRCIDARPSQTETVAYGISRSLCGTEVLVDFGDGTTGDISMAKLTFRTQDQARDAYCKGIRLSVKVVEHPKHDL